MKKIAIIGSRDGFRKINYFAAVEAAGAKTVALCTPEELDGLDDVCGMLLTGGEDVDPALYGEEDTCCFGVNKERDALEIEAIKRAVERKIPILGICRGMQILNVYFGGSLEQDIPRLDIHTGSLEEDKVHIAKAIEGSFLYEIYGQSVTAINSNHHQAAKRMGEGLMAVQMSEDGVVEAMVHESLPVIGVQWHPERMSLKNRRADTVDGMPLFQYFVDMC